MHELLRHLRERESAVPHLYCDDRGLVTIAVGFLVDKEGAPDAVGRSLAGQLARRPGVRFTRDGSRVSAADLEEDWQAVKDHARRHRQVPATSYARVARLRIDATSIENLTQPLVTSFLNDLYRRKPFMMHYDPKVAMAFVDVRYNPAKVKLYQQDALWCSLDPAHRDFNPERAVVLFERTWAFRGPVRYGHRHWMRTQWLREGLTDSRNRRALSLQSV